MATLKVENREKDRKTLTHKEKNALIDMLKNPTIYFQTIPIKRKKLRRV